MILALGVSSCTTKKQGLASPGNLTSDTTLKESRFAYSFINACSERMKGNLQEALKLFLDCKKMDPKNSAVNYELGMVYKLLGLNDLALSEAKICAAADQKNEWYQLLLIDCYASSKQYSQSVKIRETLVKNFPDRNDFKQDLAYEYAMIGQYEKAFKVYNDLEKNYGTNEQLTLNKVKLLKTLNKQEEAEVELQKLVASDNKEVRYYSYLAEFYMEQNKIEKAKEMYDKMEAIDPNNPAVNLALHDYYSMKGDEQQAFERLKRAFLNPDLDIRTKASILGSFTEQGNNASNKAQALELAKILLQIHPQSTEANSIYGEFLMLDNNIKEASNYIYKAAIYDRNNFRTWENLIYLDSELNQLDSLEKHSAMALELFPNQAFIYYYNGYANMQLKNYKSAIAAFNNGISVVVNDQGLLLRFYSGLGDAYHYAGEFQKSYQSYEQALRIDADNTYVLNNYAYFLSLRKEDLEKAEKFSRRTLELKPAEKNYMDTYGWILYQQKKYPEAEEWLSKAAKLAPNNANILEHYGDALYKNNKKEKALEIWNAAKNSGIASENLLEKIRTKTLND